MTTARKLLTMVLLGLATLALVASGEPEKAKSADKPADSQDSVAPQVFSVGEAVELGDYQVVVHGVSDLQPTNEFATPAEGMKWVAADTEVTNNSAEPTIISSLMQFEIQDSTNAAYNVTVTGENLPSLDGEAPPGGARRGTLVFEVPLAATGLRMNFEGDLFGAGSAAIQLTP